MYGLTEMVKKYMEYLKQVNNSIKELYRLSQPAWNGIENIIAKIIETNDQPDSIYNDLSCAILNLNNYEYINIK